MVIDVKRIAGQWIALLLTLVVLGCQTHVHHWTEPTCTTPRVCAECGATEGKALGHDWTEATCTAPRTCARCGAVEGEPLGHQWSESSCEEESVCLRCGETAPAPGHDWKEATCTRPRTCTRCGQTEGYLLGHDMHGGVCSRCGFTVFAPYEGRGDAVIENVQTGNGVYRVRFLHRRGGDCTVWAYDADGKADLIVFVRGNYEGTVLLLGPAPHTFEIFTDGYWQLCIEQLDVYPETPFYGTGDAVTDAAALTSGTYLLTYHGENDFVVWLYTGDGETLLAQELGACEIKTEISIPEGSIAFFAVRADAEWAIEPLGDPDGSQAK